MNLRPFIHRVRKAAKDVASTVSRQSGATRIYYSYISRHKPNAAFIWIPKNAGYSVLEALKVHGCPQLREPEDVKDIFPNRGIATFSHMDYVRLVAEGHVSEAFDSTSYKFCFSRDPYDRAVSLFFYLKRIGQLEKEKAFLEFCRLLANNKVPDIGLYNFRWISQCNPQVRWTKGISIDYIGKVENLKSGLEYVFSCLNLPFVSTNTRKNITKHDRSEVYYCEETKAIVEDYYSEDFETFGYPVRDFL